MAFLDNSGDIILDAVLTDTGRMRLAKGDGTFKIVKFALGDEEINYELYDKNTTTDLADLEILKQLIMHMLMTIKYSSQHLMYKGKLMH